ncbi:hypothetical protein [Asanoa sp. NPDC050611]|uniref:hypothetical protein n=1 Tax=Asanoa sp. NPDC050611 TaxID=3157098 RepID=UPI0033D9F727
MTGAPAQAYPKTVPCNAVALQKAVVAADNAGGGTLNLTPRCTYRITAPASTANAFAVVTTPIRINGNRATIVRTVATSFRFFQVEESGNLTLTALTLREGRSDNGGAISVNRGRLTLIGSTVTANTAELGGGIYNLGTVRVVGGVISNNVAVQGGGLNNQGVTATLDGTTVSGNHALTDFADGFGGGILNAAPLTLTRTRIVKNQAIGEGAEGGGVWNFDELTMNRGVVRDNVANGDGALGGGMVNSGAAKVTDTRFLFNAATGVNARGGAIFNLVGTTTLRGVKVVANQATGTGADGGGIFREAGTVTPTRTIVARNRPNNCGDPSTVPGCR